MTFLLSYVHLQKATLLYIIQFQFNVLSFIWAKLYCSFICSNTIFWSLMSIFYVLVYSCNYIHSNIKKNLTSSFPRYGHSGMVEAARELFMQIEGNPEGPGKKYFNFFILTVLSSVELVQSNCLFFLFPAFYDKHFGYCKVK